MLSIGELSRKTGVKVPTIRYYEQVKLVTSPPRVSVSRSYKGLGPSWMRITKGCQGDSIKDCYVIQSLSDHAMCQDGH